MPLKGMTGAGFGALSFGIFVCFVSFTSLTSFVEIVGFDGFFLLGVMRDALDCFETFVLLNVVRLDWLISITT